VRAQSPHVAYNSVTAASRLSDAGYA
jgi:hypothetical protein